LLSFLPLALTSWSSLAAAVEVPTRLVLVVLVDFDLQ
jgi:hypothetical protein